MYWDSWFVERLNKRKEKGLLRELPGERSNLVDFTSNDYLGLSKIIEEIKPSLSGSTGSRLLAGDSNEHHELEEFLADFFQGESALLFNSGYQANLSLLSSLPQRNDTILYDELSHASIKDGIRLSLARHFSFRHNDLHDLEKKLNSAEGNVYVVIEGIYSMDGDEAPLKEILELSEKYKAGVIIDEAHSGGISGENGKGLSFEYKNHPAMLARLYTFGKAYGAHGACYIGRNLIKDSLINFARPFIYTTALPPHSLQLIKNKLIHQENHPELLGQLKDNIRFFKLNISNIKLEIVSSDSPIQAVIIPGNMEVREIAGKLQFNELDVRPILSPTVPAGKERLRICLHAYNDHNQIRKLVSILDQSDSAT